MTLAVALAAGAAAAPGPRPIRRPAPRQLDKVTPAERADVSPPSRRVAARPRSRPWTSWPARQGKGALHVRPAGACDYVQTPPSGATPKFDCALRPDDIVKVKYGRKNGEVYAEVAATRLFWALGFGADRMYPVQVTCRNCPIEPWYWSTEKRVDEKTFEIASIERRLPGKRIETQGGRGLALGGAGHAWTSGRAARRARIVTRSSCSWSSSRTATTRPANQKMLCPAEAVKKDAAGNETCERPAPLRAGPRVRVRRGHLLSTSKNDLAGVVGGADLEGPRAVRRQPQEVAARGR